MSTDLRFLTPGLVSYPGVQAETSSLSMQRVAYYQQSKPLRNESVTVSRRYSLDTEKFKMALSSMIQSIRYSEDETLSASFVI